MNLHSRVNNKEIKVIERAASEWKKLAAHLYIADAKIGNIAKSNNDVESACEKALSYWIQDSTRLPVNWGTLLKALRHADLNTLAYDLDQALKAGTR